MANPNVNTQTNSKAAINSIPISAGNVAIDSFSKNPSGKFQRKISGVDPLMQNYTESSNFEKKHKKKFEVVEDPNIQLGLPTIKGTRWPVRDIVELVETDGLEDTLQSFRSLSKEMVKFAIQYVKKHPEIMRNS